MFESRVDLGLLQNSITTIREEMAKVIVGQEKMIELLLVGLLADGHILLEGLPGVAKTLTAKLFARIIDVKFSRIQFTPDLMPSDVLGTSVFNPKTSEFDFKSGPVFANIILIDEINRSPAKTQAALFEVMEEKQITIDGTTYPMTLPFMVLATQNPIEQEGTYRLPEAQLDRFLFKIEVGYPSLEEETKILAQAQARSGKIEIENITPILSADMIRHYRQKVQEVRVEQVLLNYIAQIVSKTRQHPSLYLGASPRASLAILNTAKAYAAIQGRDFVNPDDAKAMVAPVLRHRVLLTPEREMEGIGIDQVITQIVQSVEVPREVS